MGSLSQIINSDATHKRAQAQIDAARITQASGNDRRAAEASLQRTGQSVGNRRIMDSAGDQIGAITENVARNLDASTSGTLSQRIAAAEQMGSTIAAASAAGVGGSSVDMYKATLALHERMAEEQSSRAVASDNYAASAAKGNVFTNAVDSLDHTAVSANLDYTQYLDHKKMNGLTKYMALTTAATATYFGGPQAGMAVTDLFQAQNDMQNGDFGAGQAHVENAAKGAMSGWKTYSSLAQEGSNGEAWGKGTWDSVNSILKSIKL